MTPKEIKTLGHAFFDGKVLQFRPWEVDRRDGKAWVDWPEKYCPDFDIHPEWRIKPDEPKKVKLEAWINDNGFLVHKADFGGGYVVDVSWIRVPELDREITLPKGE